MNEKQQNAVNFRNYLIEELKKQFPKNKKSAFNGISAKVDEKTDNLKVHIPKNVSMNLMNTDEGKKANLQLLGEITAQFSRDYKTLTRTKYTGDGMVVEDVISDGDVAGAMYIIKLAEDPIPAPIVSRPGVEVPLEVSGIQALSLDRSKPTKPIVPKHVHIERPPAVENADSDDEEEKPQKSRGYFHVSAQTQCNKPMVKAAFCTMLKRSGEIILDKEDRAAFIGMAAQIMGVVLEPTSSNVDPNDEMTMNVSQEECPSLAAPIKVTVVDEGFANDYYSTLRAHGTHNSVSCLPKFTFLGTSEQEAAQNFRPDQPFIIAEAGSQIFAGDLDITSKYKFNPIMYNTLQEIIPMLKTLVCKIKLFQNENQDLNMRLTAPGNTKALIIQLYDDLAETNVNLGAKDFFMAVCESIPAGDLELIKRTINTATLACRETEKNKMTTMCELFGVPVPETMGDISSHVYKLSGTLDAFYGIARDTTYIDKRYAFNPNNPTGRDLIRMTEQAELMNAVRFGVCMMAGGIKNPMYASLADFKQPRLQAKVEELFETIRTSIDEINAMSANQIVSMFNGLFKEEYATEYIAFVDTIKNIVTSQPRVLPLSQDKHMLQRASHVGLSGAFALNTLIMNGKSCDELQYSTLLNEVQRYITQEVSSLYTQMPESDQVNVKQILGEVSAMGVANFMSQSFVDFVMGKVTDSREFVTTLMLLENSGTLSGTHVEAMKQALVQFIGSDETMKKRDLLQGISKSEMKNVINCHITEIKGSFARISKSGRLAVKSLQDQANLLRSAIRQ